MGSARDGSPGPMRASGFTRLTQAIRLLLYLASAVAFPDRRRRPQSIPRYPPSVGAGYAIWSIPELIGHSSAGLTVNCAYVLNWGGRGVRSPVDSLGAPPGPGVIGGNGITPQ